MNQTALVAPHLVAFLPWLRLKEPQTIGGFDFTPYRDREVRPNFAAVSKKLCAHMPVPAIGKRAAVVRSHPRLVDAAARDRVQS